MEQQQHSRRWWILALLGLAQLMVVLDATIVNIALPSAQHALGFSDDARQWIVTGYALAFGSLLLLGGRVRDRRPGRLLRRARLGPRAAGRVRRAARPVGPRPADDDLHEPGRAR